MSSKKLAKRKTKRKHKRSPSQKKKERTHKPRKRNESITCQIMKFNLNNDKEYLNYQQFVEDCEKDSEKAYFSRGYGCRYLTNPLAHEPNELPSDYIYVSYFKKNNINNICGYLAVKYSKDHNSNVDAFQIDVIATKAYGNRKKYKGIGTMLVRRMVEDAKKDERINFIIVAGIVPNFYLKMGFKTIGAGSTPYFVYKIRKYPGLNRFRYLSEAEELHLWKKVYEHTIGIRTLDITKEEDNIVHWARKYGFFSEIKKFWDQYPLLEDHSYLFTDFTDVKLHPDWMYKQDLPREGKLKPPKAPHKVL